MNLLARLVTLLWLLFTMQVVFLTLSLTSYSSDWFVVWCCAGTAYNFWIAARDTARLAAS